MYYDICMRSIERIEDTLAEAWALRHGAARTAFDYLGFHFEFPNFEILDFEQ